MSESKPKEQNSLGLSRRAFLRLLVLSGGGAVAGRFIGQPALSAPVSTSGNEGAIAEKRIATSCLNCSSRCAIRVRIVNGKAVKITGNTLSRVTEGSTCPRAQIGLQVLYDPDRLTAPVKRTNPEKGKGVDPQWTPVSWDEALGEVSQRLRVVRDSGKPHQLLLLYGLNSIAAEDVMHRFASAYGTPNIISADALDSEADKAGEWLADGNYTQSAYDLAHTSYILAFGASILESQKPLARNLRMWGKIRRERPNRAKVVVIDPRRSVTAARADQWLPINPGSDGALAMALASVIISEGLYDADFIQRYTAGFDEYKELALNSYRPETVAGITGIGADTIRNVAREFALARPAIAWRGRGATSWHNGSYASYAIFCLNALVGSIDVPGGVIYQENPRYRDLPEIAEDDISKKGKAQPRLDLAGTKQFPAARVVTNQVADSMLTGSPYPVEMAIGFNSNFNMTAPGQQWQEALKKVPYYVHVAPFVSEMAEYADIILPSHTFLEEWAYEHSPPGSGFPEMRIKQPVVKPLHDTRGVIYIVMEVARQTGGSTARAFAGTGENAEEFVKYRTGSLMPWEELLQKGVWAQPAYVYYKYDRVFNTPSRKFEFVSGSLEKRLKELGDPPASRLAYLPHWGQPAFLGDAAGYPLILSTYQPVLNVENGSQNYPWSQQQYLVMHGRGWTNFAELNSRTAESLGIKDGDTVWVESPSGKLKLKARVFEGVHPGVVAIARGQGHYSYGRWAKGIGVNPNQIIGIDYDRISGQSALFNTRVRVYRA